jgi:hypothetical protein
MMSMQKVINHIRNSPVTAITKKGYRDGDVEFKDIPIGIQVEILIEKGMTDDEIIAELEKYHEKKA